MKVEDAEVLYTSKIEWSAVYSENTIYCTEPGCDFNTKIDNGILTEHMIERHNYGEYPCGHAHCNFVAYSKVRHLFHYLDIDSLYHINYMSFVQGLDQ